MENHNFNVAVIINSTEDHVFTKQLANWVKTMASEDNETYYEIVDISNFQLSLLAFSEKGDDISKWKEKILAFDAFVFIAQEFNFRMLATIKNAIMISPKIWTHKVAGLITYGASDGNRALAYLKNVLLEVKITNVRTEVALNFAHDFMHGNFNPSDDNKTKLLEMLNQVKTWGLAAQSLR